MTIENGLGQKFDKDNKITQNKEWISSDILIKSLEELKEELKIWKLDTSSIAEFKEPLKITREELDKLKASLIIWETNRLNIIKSFIEKQTASKRAEVISEASRSVGEARNDMNKLAFTWVATGAMEWAKAKLEEVNNAEWTEKIGKLGELFEWAKNTWTKFTSFIAFKFPTIAKFFGWEIDSGVITDTTEKGVEKWKELVQTAQEKWKDITKSTEAEVAKKAADIKQIMLDKKIKMINDLEKRWWVKLDTSARRDKFEIVWSKYEKKIAENNKKMLEIPNSKEAVYLSDYPILYWQDSLNFVFDLVKEWIIPKEAIYCEIRNVWSKVVRFSLATWMELIWLWANWLQTVLWEISIDELGKTYESLDPQQKQLLWQILYHKWVLMSYILWAAWFVIAEAFIVPITWHERVWWTGAKMSFYTAMWKYDKATAWFDELAKMLGNTNTGPAAILRTGLVEWYAKTLITDAYLKSWEDIWKFKNSLEQLRRFTDDSKFDKSSKLLNEILNKKISSLHTSVVQLERSWIKSWKPLAELLMSEIKSPWMNKQLTTTGTWIARFRRFFTGTPSVPELHVDEAINSIDSYTRWLSDAIRNREGFNGIMAQIKNIFKIHEVPWSMNKAFAAVHVSDVTKARELASRLLQECPTLARAFFNNLSIVIITAWVMAESKDAWILEKIKKFWEWMTMLFPWVAAYHMFREWTKYERGSFSNVWLIGTSMVIWWMEAAEIIGAIGSTMSGSSNWWWRLLRLVWRPVIAPLEFLWWISKTWFALVKWIGAIVEAWKIWEMWEVANLCKRWVLTSLVIAVIAICAKLTYDSNTKISEDDMVAEMKKKWIIDEQGNYNPTKIKENIASLSDTDKGKIITTFATNALNKESVTEDKVALDQWSKTDILEKDFDIKKEGNKFVLVFNDCVKFYEKKYLENEFSNLWIAVDCRYWSDAVKKYVNQYKKEWFSKETFVENMKTLWIFWSEKFWDA